MVGQLLYQRAGQREGESSIPKGGGGPSAWTCEAGETRGGRRVPEAAWGRCRARQQQRHRPTLASCVLLASEPQGFGKAQPTSKLSEVRITAEGATFLYSAYGSAHGTVSVHPRRTACLSSLTMGPACLSSRNGRPAKRHCHCHSTSLVQAIERTHMGDHGVGPC